MAAFNNNDGTAADEETGAATGQQDHGTTTTNDNNNSSVLRTTAPAIGGGVTLTTSETTVFGLEVVKDPKTHLLHLTRAAAVTAAAPAHDGSDSFPVGVMATVVPLNSTNSTTAAFHGAAVTNSASTKDRVTATTVFGLALEEDPKTHLLHLAGRAPATAVGRQQSLRMSALTLGANATAGAETTTFVFSHCAELESVQEVGKRLPVGDEPLSPTVCEVFCSSFGEQSFYFLLRGDECVCASGFQQVPFGVPPVCNQPCAGDKESTCGGGGQSSSSWSVYIMAKVPCDEKYGKGPVADGVDKHLVKAKGTLDHLFKVLQRDERSPLRQSLTEHFGAKKVAAAPAAATAHA